MTPPLETVLLCPRNDEESLLILKIAQKAGIPTLVSRQPHGSRLEREERLFERIKETNPNAKTVVIVETPGPETEKELEKAGYNLVIIDHHRYEGLNRMKDQSSLEQFLEVFGIEDEKLAELGFDPFLVRGVGMIDRGFLWELKKEGLSKEEQKQVRDYYVILLNELGGVQKEAVDEAKRAWENKEERDGVFIVRSNRDDVRIREALSFLIADLYERPPATLILEGNGRLAFQDTDAAPKLHETFGGYVFGKDRCWGFLPTEERAAPLIEQILEVVKSA